MNLIINKLCLKDEFIITLIPNMVTKDQLTPRTPIASHKDDKVFIQASGLACEVYVEVSLLRSLPTTVCEI